MGSEDITAVRGRVYGDEQEEKCEASQVGEGAKRDKSQRTKTPGTALGSLRVSAFHL